MSSKIEWTEKTWNPVVGCTKISAGCKNCYAETMAIRLKAMGTKGYENGFEVNLRSERLNEPLKTKKPTIYFVNSMGELFHEKIPFEYIDRVMEVIKQTPQHIYQIVTKRANIMADYFANREVPTNAWLGVTVENKIHGLPRLDIFRNIKANIRFLSVEPLLEDIGRIDLRGINWVIVGGESGNKARAMKPEWAINVKNQCQESKVAFFFKQWGTWGADGVKRNKKANGKFIEGQEFVDMPKVWYI